MNFSLYL